MMRRALPLVLSIAVLARPASAQYAGGAPVLLQGILDGEFWATKATSNLLTRHSGRPAGLARLQVWGAYQPSGGLVFFGQAEGETGSARTEPGSEVYADQYGARYVFSPALVVDAGRFTPMIGTFASRHFSTRNPLIGEPDGYTVDYPRGVKVSGEAKHFDYRVGVLDRPTTHTSYEPEPSPRLRPAAGAGFTPFTGFRIGASATRGSYLDRATPAAGLFSRAWSDYQQTVIAADVEFSRGYFDAHVEGARGRYEVPGHADVTGFTYYGEARYALTPRFFVAARGERNKYPFIRLGSTGVWAARLTDFVDGEIGGGYRLTSSTILKMSLRGDRWWVRPNSIGFRGQGGQAFAAQLSQAFDVMEWLDRARE